MAAMVRHHVRSYGQNKIVAIKLVRELTGCGLKEAKDLVEQNGSFFVTATAEAQARIAEEAGRLGIEFDPLLDGTMTSSTPYRGFEQAGGHAIRYVSGPNKIMAIKLVRELTGLGLKEAKDLVEQGGLVRTRLSATEAEAIARQFLDIGSQIEVVGANGSGAARRFDYQREDDYDF